MMKKITFRAILLVAVVLCGMTGSLKAQVTLIYPDATPAATFTTIKAAYDSIYFPNHTGAHTIQIEGTYSASAETYPIVLGAKTDASSSNKVTIKPAAGAKITLGPANQTVIATVTASTFAANAAATVDVDLSGIITNGSFDQIAVGSYISGIGTYTGGTFKTVTAVDAATNKLTAAIGAFTATSIAGNKLYIGPAQTRAFYFNGAKYVTIDGVSRTDANTGLTIQNPNCIYAQTILFGGASQYNTVKNCIIRGANQSGAWNNGYNGTIYFSGATYTTITNNDVCDMNDANIPYPIAAFQMTAAGGTNNNQTITYNNIYNVSNRYSGNGNYTFMQFGSDANSVNNNISYNRFYWTAPTTFRTTGFTFFGFATIGLGNKFVGNVLGYGASDGTGKSILTMTGSGTSYAINGMKNSVCKNNIIGGIEINGTSFVGLGLAAHTAVIDADSICYGNQVKDVAVNCTANGTLYGIMFSAAPFSNVNVKNNTVKNLTISSGTATVVNTVLGYSANFGSSGSVDINIVNNEFSNFTAGKSGSSANNVVTGIVSGGCDRTFDKNLIYNLKTISSGTGSMIKGIRITLSVASTIKLVKNNIIRLGTDVDSDAEISAIHSDGLSSNGHAFNIYHNSVYIGGTSQTKPSHCFSSPTAVNYGLITVQNNVFSNVRTGGAVNQIFNMMSLPVIANSGNNLYQYGTKFATVTTTSPATYATLSDWNSERILASPTSLSEDVNSKDQLVPQFADATAAIPDMHLPSSSPANETGIALAAVTDDFAGLLRSDYVTASTTNADMGAYAISNSTAVETAKQLTNVSVYGVQNNIRFANLSGKTASVYSFSGQMLKSVKLTSDQVSVPATKGLYLVTVNGEVSKVMVK